MYVKKLVWSFLMVGILWSYVVTSSAKAEGSSLQSELLNHAGKSYTGVEDASYQDYDSVLRKYVAGRISKRFGIALDPKNYSGFELLEIEALFKCKKLEESFDIFLKAF